MEIFEILRLRLRFRGFWVGVDGVGLLSWDRREVGEWEGRGGDGGFGVGCGVVWDVKVREEFRKEIR